MRKLLALLLVVLMTISVVACAQQTTSEPKHSQTAVETTDDNASSDTGDDNDAAHNDTSNTSEQLIAVEELSGRYESVEHSGKFFIFDEEGILYCWSSEADPVSLMVSKWETEGNRLIVFDATGNGGGVFEIVCDNNTVVQLKFIEYLKGSAGALGGNIEFFSTLKKCSVAE